jgi:hypothetical protein
MLTFCLQIYNKFLQVANFPMGKVDNVKNSQRDGLQKNHPAASLKIVVGVMPLACRWEPPTRHPLLSFY